MIADAQYEDAGKWLVIHNGNLDLIGPKPSSIQVGMNLQLPCLNGLPTGLPGGRTITAEPVAAQPVQIAAGDASVRHRVNLLTADGFEPFTGKSLHNGGMMTEVLDAAMQYAAPEEGYAIHWVVLWTSHEDPLLSNALLDAGFPWYQPDCASNPEAARCVNFHFSDPMFELLVLMFTPQGSGLTFEKTRICLARPSVVRRDTSFTCLTSRIATGCAMVKSR